MNASSAAASSASGKAPSTTGSSASSSSTARVTPARIPSSSDGVKSVSPRRHQTFVVGPSSTIPSGLTKTASSAPRRRASSIAAMFTA